MKYSYAIAAALFLLGSQVARADLLIRDGHVRAPIPGTTSTAAYMTLQNSGDEAVSVTGVTTAAAERATLHNSMNHNGMLHMMGMDSINVPAGSIVELKEGGMHVMLEGPAATLQPGTTVELTLHLADGTAVTTTLAVRSVLDR